MDPNRGKRLYGVVVTPPAHFQDGNYTNKVYVLDAVGVPCLYRVHREAFKLRAENVVTVNGNEFDIVADIKWQMRKKEQPLDVGDWISWHYSENQDIFDFQREQKLHETRAGPYHYQLLLELVKSPTENCLFNTTFNYVKVSQQDAHNLLADTVFTAWCNIYLDADEKFVIEFDTYIETNYQMQIHICDVPWREHHKVDMSDFTLDDEEEWMVVRADGVRQDVVENNVYGIYGFYIAKGSMYAEEMPSKAFLIPYIDETFLVPGVRYKYDAYWHERMEAFVVVGAMSMIDMEPLHTLADTSDNILILESVNQRMDYKSLFFTTKFNFGAMDDPTGSLATHHLSRYADSKCRVYIYEDRNASFGRFRIERVDVDKAKKIDKNIRETITEVKGVKGVVVSSEGRIFSPTHSSLRFFLPSGSNIPIGSHIIFTAIFDNQTLELEAKEGTIKVLTDQSPLEYFEYNGRLMFKTTAEWTSRGDPVTGAVSHHFSLLDDPLKVLPAPYNKNHLKMTLWVTESGMEKEGKRRVAQTPFFVVSHSNSMPELKMPRFVDKAGRDIGGWIKLRDGSLKEMELPVEVKTVAGRFSKPGAKSSRSGDGATSLSATSLSSLPLSLPLFSPSASPSPSSTSVAHCNCGCSSDKCEAKKVLVRLMNDLRFRDLLHNSLPRETLDLVLDCMFG